ncbi:MAG: hypothetical protein HOC23_09555 [Halieaceae bacterium]|jgi:hypothetical protein|nr:hypothetical protein [Halieaceae bacterium]
MWNFLKRCTASIALCLSLATVISGCQSANVDVKGPSPSFGRASDVNYADQLWRSLLAERIAGPNPFTNPPFFGGARPHGTILELAHKNIAVAGHNGFVVVKKNYDGEGVSVAAVAADRQRFLSSITVMFERESGYDEDNQNWFWVKYRPDGTLFDKVVAGKSVALAGRISKGATAQDSGGCIYCHSSAGGGDYIFYPEIRKP